MGRRFIYRLHAIQRLKERGIGLNAARQIIETGEIIRDYRDAKPFPSRLILGWVGTRPIHILVADHPDGDVTYVITVYEPDSLLWDEAFRNRRSR